MIADHNAKSTAAEVAGVRVDLFQRATALSYLRDALNGRAALCAVHTLNPEIIMHAFCNPHYAEILNTGSLNVVDGVGLQKALLKRVGAEVDRICGSDLIFDLAEMAQHANRPLFLLGGTSSRLEKAKVALRSLYPNLEVAGLSPAFTPNLPLHEQTSLENLLRNLRPGVIAVFLGAPRQETWIFENRELLVDCDVRIAAGLGGTVDFLSGEVVRAPEWIRTMGLEWGFRLIQEPRRLKRQLSSLPEFALRAIFSRRFVTLLDKSGSKQL